MRKFHSIAELYRAEGEPGVDGLYRPDAEALAAELAGLERGSWYDPAPHFDEELRAGRCVAYGFSRKWGKRVLIHSPWDHYGLLFDDLGKLWGHGDHFTEALFYRLADHTEIGGDVDANESENAAPNPPHTPRIGRPSKAADIKKAFRELEDENAIDFGEPMARVYPLIRRKITKKEEVSKGLSDEAIRLAISPLFNARKVARKVANKL